MRIMIEDHFYWCTALKRWVFLDQKENMVIGSDHFQAKKNKCEMFSFQAISPPYFPQWFPSWLCKYMMRQIGKEIHFQVRSSTVPV